ncbi:PTS galactitol transporter subunit IIC [Faecalibaculum rodentium]|uniref:PTS galactitol transporter subunit IIC n=5 Tax=Faecalibaculum rodentium TaxID=1702221 RepID=UPI00255B2574|nr:PTS transporter subunit IIC [Faecalibaculum rodentium]
MDAIMQGLQWFIGLGSNVFLPIIILVIALIFGVKPGKAFISGITVGIGSIGLGLVIDLLSSTLGQAIQTMGESYGVALNILDVGCGVGGPLAFSTTIGILLIPLSLVFNFLFIGLGLTKTLNVDIWNFWFPGFLGLVAWSVSGNIFVGIIASVVAVMLQWLLADIFQDKISRFFGFPGIAISHMMALSGAALAAPMNWIMDRIPGLNKLNADAETLTKRFGIFGDTVVMGLIIGAVVGVAARYDAAGIGTLAMSTAAVMKIMPKMVAMFMEGLMPVAEAAKEFASRHLGGKTVNIGMDAALTVGHPTVMSTALILVPVSLILALVLPGNRVLPFGELAFYAFGICLMIPFFNGNMVRSLIGCTVYMILCLYLSNWLAPVVTEVFQLAHFDVGSTGLVTFVLSGLWPVALFVLAVTYLGPWGLLVVAAVVVVLMIYVNKVRPAKGTDSSQRVQEAQG